MVRLACRDRLFGSSFVGEHGEPRAPTKMGNAEDSTVKVIDGGPLAPRPGRPRVRGGQVARTAQLVIGEWCLTAAAWTDRHQHEETNWVLEGELRVTCQGRHEVVRPGQVVVVPTTATPAPIGTTKSWPTTPAVTRP
jgi:quercetin dioxygenase-like cupin family protein